MTRNIIASLETRTAFQSALDSVDESRVTKMVSRNNKAIALHVNSALEMRGVVVEENDSFESRLASLKSSNPDYKFLEQFLNSRGTAAFGLASGINTEVMLNSVSYSREEFEKKSRIPACAYTRNVKGLNKTFSAIHYVSSVPGFDLEAVQKSFIASALVAHGHMLVLPREDCTRFLSAVRINHVSDELADHLSKYQAVHMSGGAATQTSQNILTLAGLGAANVVQNGKHKDCALNLDSIVLESIAQRFGMVPELERAKEFRLRCA